MEELGKEAVFIIPALATVFTTLPGCENYSHYYTQNQHQYDGTEGAAPQLLQINCSYQLNMLIKSFISFSKMLVELLALFYEVLYLTFLGAFASSINEKSNLINLFLIFRPALLQWERIKPL